MVSFVRSCVATLLLFSLSLASGDRLQFDAWLETHEKSYTDKREYQKRMGIFLENAARIERHNEAYAAGLTLYSMTVNSPFTDLTDTEFTDLYLMQESRNCSATHVSSGSIVAGPRPKFVDWRTRGIITPIKNQKHCGSCWTFSTTGTLEAHTCLYGRKHDVDCTKWTGLAEQQLLDCASAYDNHGCNGGLPSHAFEYIKHAGGIDTEVSYPYQANETGTCSKNRRTYGAHVAETFNITANDEDDLVAAIAAVGPVSIAYQVTPDFRFYSHGVYDSFNSTTNETMCSDDSQSVNHAVVAVGYGETDATDKDPSVPYYIVRNSWSSSWGMEGYFWMLRGHNLCGVSDCASFPIVPTRNGGLSYEPKEKEETSTSLLRKKLK